MMKTFSLLLFLLYATAIIAQDLSSPNGMFSLKFELVNGTPTYALNLEGSAVIAKSKLGLELKDTESLLGGFTVEGYDSDMVDETWEPVWGETKTIRNHYNEMTVRLLQENTNRKLLIRFRLFNDGLGFRYEFPEQADLTYFVIAEERTQFAMTGDHTAF